MKKSFLFVLLISISMFSCKKIAEELEKIGKFNSTFSGAIDKQFDGEAAFVHTIRKTTQPNGSGMVITLTEIDNQDEVVLLTLTSMLTTGIEAGTYSYDDSGTATTIFLPSYSDQNATDLYIVDIDQPNSITISSVEELVVKGEFELNMITPATSPKKLKIKGTFDAVGTTLNQ